MTRTTLPSFRRKALADAMGTARILLRMLDLLKAAGITPLAVGNALGSRSESPQRPADGLIRRHAASS